MRKLITGMLVLLSMVAHGCGGDASTIELSGHVRLEDGSPVPGVKVTFFWPAFGTAGGGGPLVTTTDANGRFSYRYGDNFSKEQVTITPQGETYTFSPPSYDLPSANKGYANLDFTALQSPN